MLFYSFFGYDLDTEWYLGVSEIAFIFFLILNSLAGIPVSPASEKKLHLYLMTWLIIAIWHMPIYGMQDLCRCATHFSFLDLFNSLILVYRNSVLYILIGITLSSLPVSNLNWHISVFTVLCFHFYKYIWSNTLKIESF